MHSTSSVHNTVMLSKTSGYHWTNIFAKYTLDCGTSYNKYYTELKSLRKNIIKFILHCVRKSGLLHPISLLKKLTFFTCFKFRDRKYFKLNKASIKKQIKNHIFMYFPI